MDKERIEAIRNRRSESSEIVRAKGAFRYKPVTLTLADVDVLLAALAEAEAEVERLRTEFASMGQPVPRCTGQTKAGFQCSRGMGHPGPHSHPREAEALASQPGEETAS